MENVLNIFLITLLAGIMVFVIQRMVHNKDEVYKSWSYIREDLSSNFNQLDFQIDMLNEELELQKETSGYFIYPLKKFNCNFWNIYLMKIPVSETKNENIANHLRILEQRFININDLSRMRHDYILNRFGAESLQKCNEMLLNELELTKRHLINLDEEYSIVVRFKEDKDSVIEKLRERDPEYREYNNER